ncbi:hypothetical protein [Demequina maris]|uniref:hypothetical protein n=1 Tax=Demequina maris TaxID=1638982 RepID=UPI000782FED1|nr:hypothetical protein [Demequina maris]
MHQRTLATAASAAAATAALLATASAASAEDASPSPSPSVSDTPVAAAVATTEIHASLLAMLASTGADMAVKMFSVDDVVVGDGPELTAADLDPDFTEGDMCGDLEIDIDLTTSTVAVTGTGDACEVSLAGVYVFFYNGPVVEDVTLVSDGLFGGVDFFQEAQAWDFGFDAGWGDPAWFDFELDEEPTTSAVLGGTSVLSLTFGDELIEDYDWGWSGSGPDDLVEEVIEKSADVADAAAPVAATPSFTG